MSRVIVNLTLPLVLEAIESVLEGYPHYPYREAFASPDLRKNLVAYVLSRFPNSYTAVDECEQDICFQRPLFSQEQRHNLETLISQGIQYFAQEHPDEFRHAAPEIVEGAYSPSHWFG